MMTREEFEALEREFEEQMATPLPRAKPTVTVVAVPLSAGDAAVVTANPESVRVSARREDGVTVLMKPVSNGLVRVCVEQVQEVDGEGRPVWPQAGVVHQYNPLDALRRRD